MRHALQVLAAILLAAAVAAPVAATTAGATQETLTGIVETAYVELGDGRDHFVTTLRSRQQITPLEFAQGNPRSLAGAKVTVTGTRRGGTLVVRSTEPGESLRVRQRGRTTELGAWAAETDGTTALGGGSGSSVSLASTGTGTLVRSVAVVLFNFTDLATTPFTRTQVQTALSGSSTSTKAFFEEESKGRMAMSGSVFGWYTIDDTTAGCDWPTWTTLAWNAATAAGNDLNAFTNVMFVFPSTSACGWAGLGYVPGRYSYLNGNISVQVMTHELGHNFGLSHSNAANCAVGGSRVMIAAPTDCSTVGYADPFSTMGNNALRHNHGSQLGELGWLAADEKVIGVPGNTYTVTPYFGDAGIKLVRVPRGDGSYFDLDVRMTYGAFDTFAAGSPVTVGIGIRIGLGTASPTTSPKGTLLLDSTPATVTLSDAPLAVGKTMTDPVSGISIKTMSADASGVVVRVREGNPPTAPGNLAAGTTPDGVALSWTRATDDTAVTGYRVSRDGSLLTTTDADAQGWTDPAATAGSTYTYLVVAVDGSTNESPAASVGITVGDEGPAPTPTDPGGDAQAPSAPETLTGEATATTVSLGWSPATDDTGVVGYRVTRDGTLVASPVGVAWQDTRLTPETTYLYTVAALDAVGNVSEETRVSVATLADATPPSRPPKFRKIARSGKYVTFDWKPSTDNVGVVRYYVYKVGRSTPVKVTERSRARIRTARGAYYYAVALDAAGNMSERSATVRGRR